MAHIVKQNRPIERKLAPEAGGARPLREEGPDAQVRADPREVGRPRAVLHDGGVRRLLPAGRTCASTKEIKAFKLKATPSPVLLEGQGRQPGDAAHLRVRLLHEGGAGPAPLPHRGGQAARPPQARPRARPVLDRRRDGRRARALAPEGRLHPQADRGLLARRALPGRLRPRLHAAHRAARPVEDERPHRLLPGQHVLADRDRERRVPAQADELPVPPDDLQVAAAQLPRPAVSAGRSWARSTASSARACCTG